MKSIILSLLIFVFTVPLFAFSQYQLKGNLFSEQGHPMPFVQTVLLDLSSFKEVEEVITDERGEFHLENIPEGDYLLMCHSMGFSAHFQKINVDTHQHLEEIVLAQSNWVTFPKTPNDFRLSASWKIVLALFALAFLWLGNSLVKRKAVPKFAYSFIGALPTNGPAEVKNPAILNRINQLLEERLDHPDLTVEKLSELMNMSKRNLYRKLEEVTDQKPKAYIKEYRLRRAKRLIQSGEVDSISEVAYQIGFSSANYFSTCYKKAFGRNPKQDFLKCS